MRLQNNHVIHGRQRQEGQGIGQVRSIGGIADFLGERSTGELYIHVVMAIHGTRSVVSTAVVGMQSSPLPTAIQAQMQVCASQLHGEEGDREDRRPATRRE